MGIIYNVELSAYRWLLLGVIIGAAFYASSNVLLNALITLRCTKVQLILQVGMLALSTGVKLSEYIYQERIAKAKYLLSTSSDSMQAIAAAIGFDSPQYFSLVFKKSVGITPSEYQRIHYHESMTELPANE